MQGQLTKLQVEYQAKVQEMADNETAVLTANVVQQNLEKKLQQQIQETIKIQEDHAANLKASNELKDEILKVTREKCKVENTLKKVAELADE